MRKGKQENYINTGDAYADIEGNMKQFTHVDHDPKLNVTIGSYPDATEIWNKN